MSPDLDWLIAAPLLLGQLGLFVVIVNMVHALGISHRRLDAFNRIILAIFLVLTAVLVGCLVAEPWSGWPWYLKAYSLVCGLTALVGWPLATIVRHARRMPRGISGKETEVDLAAAEGTEALIGTGKYSWMLRLPGNESFRIRKREWEVVIPGLPDEWDGLSLVHLTDLHLARCFQRRFFEAVADEAAGWGADLVAFTGDLIDDDAALDWVVPVLSRVRGRLGSFAILGNHDCKHEPRQVRRAVTAAGFTDLDGRWARLEIEGASLAVGGTSYPWGPALDPREMPEADFRLLLSHTPDRFATAARWGMDLVLSGHNHAGQIRLPIIGPVFMPSLYSRHYDRGFFRSGRTLMYVSQGIAGKHPVRYGDCFPELARLVLRAARPGGAERSGLRSESSGKVFNTLG